MRVVFIIWLAYGFPMMFWNLLTLYCIWKWRKTLKSFYHFLVRCDIFINVLCWIHTWIKRIATDPELSKSLISIVKEREYMLMATDYISNWFYHMQGASLLLKVWFVFHLSISPTAKVSWPKNCFWIFFAAVSVTLFVTIPYAWASNLESIVYNGTTNTLDYNPNSWRELSWWMDLEVGFHICLTVVSGIVTFRSLKRYSEDRTARLRRRIALMTVCNTFLHSTVWIWHILSHHLGMSAEFSAPMLFFVSDLISCSAPVTLLTFDSVFRELFLTKVLCWERASKVEPSRIPSPALSAPDN